MNGLANFMYEHTKLVRSVIICVLLQLFILERKHYVSANLGLGILPGCGAIQSLTEVVDKQIIEIINE